MGCYGLLCIYHGFDVSGSRILTYFDFTTFKLQKVGISKVDETARLKRNLNNDFAYNLVVYPPPSKNDMLILLRIF